MQCEAEHGEHVGIPGAGTPVSRKAWPHWALHGAISCLHLHLHLGQPRPGLWLVLTLSMCPL